MSLRGIPKGWTTLVTLLGAVTLVAGGAGSASGTPPSSPQKRVQKAVPGASRKIARRVKGRPYDPKTSRAVPRRQRTTSSALVPDVAGKPAKRFRHYNWPVGKHVPMRWPQRATTARKPGDPRPKASPRATDDPVFTIRNSQLSPPDLLQTSIPTEPTFANAGSVVFATGNTWVARSADGGATWTYRDPATIFGDSPVQPFNYDQVVRYAPSINRFVWLLQRDPGPGTEENAYRLAYATPDELLQDTWSYVDLSSDDLDCNGKFLDYPDVSIGDSYLYFTFNIFPNNDGANAENAEIVRIPLADLGSGSITYSYYRPSFLFPSFSFRMAQTALFTAYWGATVDGSTVRIFSWPEGTNDVTSQDVSVASYANQPADYTSLTPGPGTRWDWLNRADPRMQGAAHNGSELWFAWTCGRDVGAGRPQPYVRILRVATATMEVIEERDLSISQYAYAYPSLTTNPVGEVAISMAYGGGDRMPGHVVGLLTGNMELLQVANGTHGPNGNRWGDYFSVQPYYPYEGLFIASGYSQQGSANTTGVVPNYVVFGRGPLAHMNFPNGGEALNSDTPISIRWDAQGLGGLVDIQLTRDNGFGYQAIAFNQANDGEFTWTPTGPDTVQARIRISFSDQADTYDESDGTFSITRSGDPYEPDQDPNRVARIEPGETQTRSIHQPQNFDLIEFVLDAPRTVVIQTQSTVGPGDVLLELIGTLNNQFQQLALASEPAGSDTARLVRASLPPGRYLIRVDDDGRDENIGEYTLSLSSRLGDAYEPDDELGGAVIRDGDTQDRTIHNTGDGADVDYAVFDVAVHSTAFVETAPGTPAALTYLRVRGPDNQQLIGTPFGVPNGYARFKYMCLEPGRYKIETSTSNSELIDYQLSLTLTPDVLPAAPEMLPFEYTPSPRSLRIKFRDKADNEQASRLYGSTDGGATWTVRVFGIDYAGTGTVTDYVDDTIVPGNRYLFRASAINCKGETFSATQEVIIPGGGPPAAPTNARAVALTDKIILLTWDDPATNETGFEVFRSTSATSGFVKIGALPAHSGTGAGAFFADTKAAAGKKYFYRIVAVNGSQASAHASTSATALSAGKNAFGINSPVKVNGKVGRPGSVNVTVRNPTPFPLTGTLTISQTPPYSISPSGSLDLGAGASKAFTITFAPANTRKPKEGKLSLKLGGLFAAVPAITGTVQGVLR